MSGLFDSLKNSQLDDDGLQSSRIIRVLTRYVTKKQTDDVSLKQLIDQKLISEKVYDGIFSKFTRGQKLNVYDEQKELKNLLKLERLSMVRISTLKNRMQMKKQKKEEQLKQINQIEEEAKKQREEIGMVTGCRYMQTKSAEEEQRRRRF